MIHERMAELWTLQKCRPLSREETEELSICLEANANYIWKMVKLHNLSLTASITNDREWLQDICLKMEQLEAAYQTPFRKLE